MTTIEIQSVLDAPCCSSWLRMSLLAALKRDAVDAANDAEVLFQLLTNRCEILLTTHAYKPRAQETQ